jgi:hypothetical protein
MPEPMKKPFVEPVLTEEASLAKITLVSGSTTSRPRYWG